MLFEFRLRNLIGVGLAFRVMCIRTRPREIAIRKVLKGFAGF